MSFVEFGKSHRIFYERFGSGPQTILFIHGWLGSSKWWASQKDFFKGAYDVVFMDLPGHGKSSAFRSYSSDIYIDSIKAILQLARAEKVYIVAHSMAALFALEAVLGLTCVRGIVLVDTLKNIEKHMNYSQADELLFKNYRTDFKNAIKNLLPQFLFTKDTPVQVRRKILKEFSKVESKDAIALIEPLYRLDACQIAKKNTLPVWAINSDSSPTNEMVNRKYLSDYKVWNLSKTGHYPMLEIPDQFNRCLKEVLLSMIQPHPP